MKNQVSFNFIANSELELLEILQWTDTFVPAVTEGRTKEHCERYTMARFLSTMSDPPNMSYPLRVEHRDKPDFVIHFGSGLIGIECVQAVPQEWYEIAAIRERSFPDSISFGQTFKPNERLFTKEDKYDIACGNLMGPPWVGDMAARQWADAMEFFVRGKTEKLLRGNYSEFPNMWLLIQDEWRVPIYHRDEMITAAEMSLPKITQLQQFNGFEKIYICCRDWLLTYQNGDLTMKSIRDVRSVISKEV